jgi:predicted nucleic acid-binding Zn ribbon protein
MTWGIFKEDSVSEAYKKMKAEELKGKQHKLDVNKNGKIDGEDLAKLRKEETELDESVAKVAQAHGFQKGSGINKGSYVHPKTGHTITALSNDKFGHSAKDGKTISSFKAAKDLESHLAKHGYTKESVDESVNKSDIPAYKRKDDKLTLAAQKKESTNYESFIELDEEADLVKTGAKEIKHANVKDKEDDKDDFGPRAQGEKDFLDQLSVNVTDDPARDGHKTGADKLKPATKPTAKGAGSYNGDSKLSSKDKASFKESASQEDSSEEAIGEASSCSTKSNGKKTYSSFKKEMKSKE